MTTGDAGLCLGFDGEDFDELLLLFFAGEDFDELRLLFSPREDLDELLCRFLSRDLDEIFLSRLSFFLSLFSSSRWSNFFFNFILSSTLTSSRIFSNSCSRTIFLMRLSSLLIVCLREDFRFDTEGQHVRHTEEDSGV